MTAAARFRALAGVTLLLAPVAAGCVVYSSARAADSAACSALRDVKVRLTCLDVAAVPGAKEGAQAPVGFGALAAPPLSADAYETVTAAHLVGQPDTALRRPIALGGARCFFFGVGDYRCIVQGISTIAVIGQVILPPGAQVAVERGCEEGNVGSPPSCEYKLLFVPFAFRRGDTGSGKTAFIFDTSAIMFAPAAAPKSVIPSRKMAP